MLSSGPSPDRRIGGRGDQGRTRRKSESQWLSLHRRKRQAEVHALQPEGLPLRATLTVTLREYKTLEEQLAQLNLTSPDRTHAHVTQRGETLSGIAAQYYRRPGDWRHIADENDIEDPRRLAAGVFLTIPPIS